MTSEQIKEYNLRVSHANASGLVLILFDIELDSLKEAVDAYNIGDSEKFSKSIAIALKANEELINIINPTNNVGRDVLSLYIFVNGKIISSRVKRMPVELEACISIMSNLRVGFESLADKDEDEPIMSNTQQVHAGLTYGKGYLNETMDVSPNRGYTI